VTFRLSRHLLLSLAAAGVLLVAPTISAQTPEPGDRPAPPNRGERLVDRLDQNGDGKLAVSELPEFMQERLKGADANGDGFITADEINAMAGPERGGDRPEGAGRGGDRRGGGAGRGGDMPGDGPMRGGAPGDRRMRGGFGDPAQMLERFDENKDGKLAKAELPERMAERMMESDLDKDGFITLEELKKAETARRTENAKRTLERFDANKDGKISKEELPERGRERLINLDTNKDGVITLEELAAPGGVAPTPSTDTRSPDQILARLDANKDGKLTGEEIPGYMRRRMEQFDKNGDGEITRDEITGPQRRRGGEQPPGGPAPQGEEPAPKKKGGIIL